MKQSVYSFFFTFFFCLALSFILASCSKEEDAILGCTYSTATNYNPSATSDDGSCSYSTEGCTDDNAMNFNVYADLDDGSCIYAYDIALGLWDIDPDCEEIDVLGQVILLDDQLPDSIDVQASGDQTLFIYISETQVSGTIDNSGIITIAEQTASINFSGIPIPVQISGSGEVESEKSGYMNLIFSGEIELIPSLPTSFSSNCYITLSR